MTFNWRLALGIVVSALLVFIITVVGYFSALGCENVPADFYAYQLGEHLLKVTGARMLIIKRLCSKRCIFKIFGFKKNRYFTDNRNFDHHMRRSVTLQKRFCPEKERSTDLNATDDIRYVRPLLTIRYTPTNTSVKGKYPPYRQSVSYEYVKLGNFPFLV